MNWNFKQPSILRRMLLSFLGFGLVMGLVFPVFASIFVNFKEGMLSWFIAACIGAGLMMGVMSYWLLQVMLLKRLQRIGEVANAISQNDISHSCTLESHDFVGEMANSFNQMVSNLRLMVTKISQVSKQLNHVAHQLNQLTSETQEGIEKQKQETKNTCGGIAEMAILIEHMTKDTQAASSAAEAANHAAHHGQEVVNLSVTAISELANEVEQSAQVIQRLRTDSETIGSVLEVIKEIAEQTNLLALNAAIEAARAGEHGRGFAVVADEVRTLASRTQDSAKQIEGMIISLQNVSHEAYQMMRAGQEKASLTVKESIEAGEALEQITESVQQIDLMNSKVAQAANQEKHHSESILMKVNSISEISEGVSKQAENTRDSSKEMEHYAEQLNSLIQQFKLN